MEAEETRVFAPGTGASPPALTGREQQQAVLSRCLSDLTRGEAPPHDIVMVGPRGNGKTVLLNWFAEACRKVSVNVTKVVPSFVPTESTLASRLLPPSRLGRLLPKRAPLAATYDWEDRLIRRCRRKPTAMLVDEAHGLDLEVGQILLNVSQDVRQKAPFVLVLAGTPGLLAHLDEMNASFWDRLEEGLLGIDLLGDAAAREALVKPLAQRNVSIDADALDSVIEHSQRFAYFVQMWGEALWNQRIATGDTQLTTGHVEAAWPTLEERTTDYYQRRYRELEAEGLLPAALAIAPLFDDGTDAKATDRNVDAALAAIGADASARLAAREDLNRLGFIWCPPGQLPPIGWSAGIPSLVRYVVDRATCSAQIHVQMTESSR